jgi:hypothetical protein
MGKGIAHGHVNFAWARGCRCPALVCMNGLRVMWCPKKDEGGAACTVGQKTVPMFGYFGKSGL